MNSLPIDIVLPWVDGNDPDWRAEKNKYDPAHSESDVRYQSWDNLEYLFRGIEQFMPWVHHVFFVTWGHIPTWLNTEYDKLTVVRHEDYIPLKYLPTFNTNVIEWNYHRIEGLSENFVLFNDDVFPIRPIPEEYYFQNDLPCGMAIETHFSLKFENPLDYDPVWLHMNVNNMVLINRYFNKREVVSRNHDKWFHPAYGDQVYKNCLLFSWNNFEMFKIPHEAKPLKKSVMAEIWNKEPVWLDLVSSQKFRSHMDLATGVIAVWQLCSGKFVPQKFEGMGFAVDSTNYKEAAQAVRNQAAPVINFNERSTKDFMCIKAEINAALASILPEKSHYEL